MKKRFSPTTVVLVAVLVGALFLVGRTVTPPPPGPPTPPPVQKASASNQMVAKRDGPDAKTRAEQMKEMMQNRAKEMKNHQHQMVPKKKDFDPNQIEISPAWTHNRIQGDEGNKLMAEKVAKAKAQEAAERAANSVPTPSPNIKPVH